MSAVPHPPLPRSAARRIARLSEIRQHYDPSSTSEKLALVGALAGMPISRSKLLLTYHELLLFLRAYPDSPALLKTVRAQLRSFARRVATLRSEDPEEAEQLDDTGIAETTTRYWYDLATVEWLVRWHGDALEIDWEEFEHSERLDALLPLLTEWAESDGLDLAPLSTAEWVALACGETSGGNDLRWLLARIRRLGGGHRLQRVLFDGLELPLRWDLGRSHASRTLAEPGHPAPYFHSDGLLRRVDDFESEIRRPLPRMAPLARRDGVRLIRTLRCALAVRHRALYPVEYASPDDVLVAECARGYQLVLYGMFPAYRLPLESDYGALILKNGQIIGYGVGALLFEQVEIAVNIFPSWRGGESVFVFSQFMRAFHQHFGSTRFKIERYQIGYENEEGISSGAFWFYHKLGFVPECAEIRELAEAELKHRRRQPGYRSSKTILRRLALSDMTFSLDDEPAEPPSSFPLAELALGTTRMIGQRFGGDRTQARRICRDELAHALRCPGWRSWPAPERTSFERFAPLLTRIPRLSAWSAAERRKLIALVRAKGLPDETAFVHRLRSHQRLRKALVALAEEEAGRT